VCHRKGAGGRDRTPIPALRECCNLGKGGERIFPLTPACMASFRVLPSVAPYRLSQLFLDVAVGVVLQGSPSNISLKTMIGLQRIKMGSSVHSRCRGSRYRGYRILCRLGQRVATLKNHFCNRGRKQRMSASDNAPPRPDSARHSAPFRMLDNTNRAVGLNSEYGRRVSKPWSSSNVSPLSLHSVASIADTVWWGAQCRPEKHETSCRPILRLSPQRQRYPNRRALR